MDKFCAAGMREVSGHAEVKKYVMGEMISKIRSDVAARAAKGGSASDSKPPNKTVIKTNAKSGQKAREQVRARADSKEKPRPKPMEVEVEEKKVEDKQEEGQHHHEDELAYDIEPAVAEKDGAEHEAVEDDEGQAKPQQSVEKHAVAPAAAAAEEDDDFDDIFG